MLRGLLYRLGTWIHDHCRRVLAIALAVLLASLVLLIEGGRLTTPTIRGLESEQAERWIERVRGFPAEMTFAVIFHARTELSDEAFKRAIEASLARARPLVKSVITADDVPISVGLLMTNPEARSALAYVTMREARGYRAVRAALESDLIEVTCTGQIPYLHDLDATLAHDLLFAELISLPLALLVLVLVFRTLTAALLAVGLCSVLTAIAAVLLISRGYDMAQYTVNVCSLIGLGVSIDYALFIVSRYREELAAGHAHREALAHALSKAGRIVMFSGVAVASGLIGLVSFRGSYLEAMGIGGVIVVLFAVCGALTVLPALLAMLGPRIRPMPPRPARLLSAIVVAVMRRPVLVLIPTLALLIVMGLPFLRLKMATADVRVLPQDVEARRGYAQMQSAFPEIAATRVAVAVRFPTPGLDASRAGALADLVQRMKAIPSVTQVETIVLQGDTPLTPPEALRAGFEESLRVFSKDDVVLVYARTDQPTESETARNIVRKIRQQRAVADGRLVVGGIIAHDVDTTDFIVGHAPRAIAIVVGATVIALFMLLGSIVLPIKAIVMNALSIAGSFGALVWVFDRPVEPTLPILLFCTLFGLSMDYEVLMLGRIKEVFEETGDNARAVAEGLARTGGLITSAAAIMVAVFGAFAFGRVVLIQSVGFGMALAVALDATLVRVLLVPATMRLFGDLNWWLPRPLARLRNAIAALVTQITSPAP